MDDITTEPVEGAEHMHDDETDMDPDGACAQKLKKAKKQLAASQKERHEYLYGWQRCKADSINIRKQTAEEKQVFMELAAANVIQALIPVLDSFDMAFANKEAWEATPKDWRVGIEYIHTQLCGVLENQRVEVLDPLGAMFDPAVHTSIGNVPAETEADDHRVLNVVQKGYKLDGKVLRSPKVNVGDYQAGKKPK